ncbi:MAG: hypothetical protein OXU23_22330 [Candidatus Poribacteria bacterium]|nr:hypothetical protein [Candidatus Poribacteria bacterium]
MLDDLESAHISFMPIGRSPDKDYGPPDFGGDRFLTRQTTLSWELRQWRASWGIQVYTGIPSELNGARWHDLHITYQAICDAPDAVMTCIETLVSFMANPLLTLTKSAGLRFTFRVLGYLHPDTADDRSYIYKHTPTPENPGHRDVYLEISGENGYSQWDSQYQILFGDLLDPPVIAKEVLFVPINHLRSALHMPAPFGTPAPLEKREVRTVPRMIPAAVPQSLKSDNLDLAKEAFLKRGFSYLKRDGDFHLWIHPNRDTCVKLWEDQEIVWIRANTPDSELPTKTTPITDIWDDTGITPPISNAGLPMKKELISIQKGERSPLAIRRPRIAHRKQESATKVYKTPKERAAQIRCAFQSDARVLSITPGTILDTNYGVELHLLDEGSTSLNIPDPDLADEAAQRYQELDPSSFARWRPRRYNWEQVKDIPEDVRMANPFQGGNVCEDPERCDTLAEKGGDPHVSICPQCPVWTTCQERGFLSQSLALQSAKVQVLPFAQPFLNPQHADTLGRIIEPVDETERIHIIDENSTEVENLFINCELSTHVLKEWSVNWDGDILASFAKALLNAIESYGGSDGNPITRIRAAMQAFEPHEEALIQQMCHVNLKCKIVTRGIVDPETGEELARFSIEFEGGVSVYIPVDNEAAQKLKAKELPFFQPRTFAPNETTKITMEMKQAIELGILDVGTVENIQEFPTVCQNPNWTSWHQLKCFFTRYKRDADAPMRCDSQKFTFWVPPMLHPSVKRLLLISPTLSEQHLRRTFPDEEIEFTRLDLSAWVASNKVFQIRTKIPPPQTILNYENNWDLMSLSKVGLSKLGERFFLAIRNEIEKDPKTTHAIITYEGILKHLSDLAEKENVCFVKHFKDTFRQESIFEAPQVLWIVGSPHSSQLTIWQRTQMLFGNDDNPLHYGHKIDPHYYKDKRMQDVYQQSAAGQLTQIIARAGLDRWTDKTFVLLTSLPLPGITDRPETLLFDWIDFQLAGGLDKLPEVIATRERFETELANLTPESKTADVIRLLECSPRTAGRVLNRIRGGNRITIREQILFLLATGEKKTSLLVEAIDSNAQTIGNELRKLMDKGEIVRVSWGLYKLPDD